MESKSSTPNPASSTWDRIRSFVYDKAIVGFTAKWYEAVLHRIPENSYVLDVGIGTGAALIANASLLRSKSLTILGVDYDAAYITTCQKAIVEARLTEHVSAVQADVRDFTPIDNRLFNYVYFSGSFMILPDQVQILKKVVELLVDREEGRVFFTQTFELKKNTFLEWLKPSLIALTTIDFGGVSYEADFDEALNAADMQVELAVVLDDGKRVPGTRESRLICARSKFYVAPETASIA